MELEQGAYGKPDGKVVNYYVTPEYAEKTLPAETVKRIKGVIEKIS